MIVSYTMEEIKKLPHKTAAEWRELENRPIAYDEDCPKPTLKELKEFRRVIPKTA